MSLCARLPGAGVGLFLLILGIGSGPVSASQSESTPQEIEGVTKVTAEQVFGLFDKLPDLLIIDSRMDAGRSNGYIEGSIGLPDIDTNCTSLERVTPKKTAPLLFYCNGPKCGRSAKAAEVALKCGYSNLYWFRGGFEEWMEKGYPYLKH